jgi:hypothetical protein
MSTRDKLEDRSEVHLLPETRYVVPRVGDFAGEKSLVNI